MNRFHMISLQNGTPILEPWFRTPEAPLPVTSGASSQICKPHWLTKTLPKTVGDNRFVTKFWGFQVLIFGTAACLSDRHNS